MADIKIKGKFKAGSAAEVEFAETSVKGSGGREFNLKGWVTEGNGPVVKFSCPWGQFTDGEVQFTPDGGAPNKTPAVQSHFFDCGNSNTLVLEFTWPDTGGTKYRARFWLWGKV
jgi:hypothetical protein